MHQINITLNLHNVMSQLYLSRAGKNIQKVFKAIILL